MNSSVIADDLGRTAEASYCIHSKCNRLQKIYIIYNNFIYIMVMCSQLTDS